MSVEIKDNKIEDLLADERLVMIDFWAGWCGPCKQIAPSIELASEEFAERLVVAKANVDENPDLASKYGVRSIPSLLFFKGGELVDRQVGAVSKPKLWEKIEDTLTRV